MPAMSRELENRVWEALKSVRFPGMSRDIVSFGFVRSVAVEGGTARVIVEMTTRDERAGAEVRAAAERAVGGIAGVAAVELEVRTSAPPTREESAARAIARDPRLIPEVRAVVAVASGKGGVGK